MDKLEFKYFPGCTLKTKAKNLDMYARKSALVFGFTLEEIDEWQCCGGMFTSSNDEIATKLSSIRALREAEKEGKPLVTVCSACHNVIKQTNHQFLTDEKFRDKVDRYLDFAGEEKYNGTARVYHYLEVIRDIVGFDEVKKHTVNPQKGLKVACYYGCLLLRPNSVMHTDDPENPQILENLVKSIGATDVYFAQRNECCGGYECMGYPSEARDRAARVAQSAKANGADIIVTACPLCKYNLEKAQTDIPVVYFTELLAKAFGIEE